MTYGKADDLDLSAFRIRETIRQEKKRAPLRVALECFLDLSFEEDDEMLLAPLYKHPDPSIRAASIIAGTAALDWSSALRAEISTEVRLAMIERIRRCASACNVNPLIQLLKDENWRIRARAADALVALAPASLPALRLALRSEMTEVRVAAAQALRQLGREDWVEAERTA